MLRIRPIGGKLPKVSITELADMTPGERVDYHSERARIFGARMMFCAYSALLLALAAVLLAVVSVVLGAAS